MDDEFERETQPAGDLIVPPRKPPTAVGLIVPPSPDRHRRKTVRRRDRLTEFFERAFDVVDELADTVAEALHLRPGARL
jgi:hypothetical protein